MEKKQEIEEDVKDVRRKLGGIKGSMQSVSSPQLKLKESRTRRMRELTQEFSELKVPSREEDIELEESARTRRMKDLTQDIRKHIAERKQELRELEEPRRTRRMNDLTKDIREHIAEMKEELGGMKDNLKCVSPPQLIK